MARYKTIDIRIWMDEKFLSLDEGTQLLFIYLLTSQHTTPIGTLSLPCHVIAAWLQKDVDTVSKRLQILSQMGLIKVSKLGLIWIRNYLKYNPPANPKVAVGYCKFFEEMPECDLQGEVAYAVISSCKSKGSEYLNGVEDKLSHYVSRFKKSSPVETVSEPYRNQEQEQEQEQEQYQYINTNKQNTEVSEAIETPEDDSVCSVSSCEENFSEDEVIDAPINVQIEHAQLQNLDKIEDEKKPLNLVELITACKGFGIRLSHSPKTEAIANRKTISLVVLRECVKAWKGTNTGPGYFIGILENASKDPNSILPHEKREKPELSAETITDKQAGYFASRLVKDVSFQTTFGVGHQSFDTFIDQVTQRLHDPEYFKEYMPWMRKLGFISTDREAV